MSDVAGDLARRDALLLRVAHQVSARDESRPGGALLGPRLLFLPAMDRLSDERLVRLGTAVELLRRATIVHRVPKAEAPWAGFGPYPFSQTLRGDTLLSESFLLLAADGEPRTVNILSRAMAGVSEGELEAAAEDAERGDDAARRRAAFFEGAAAAGALVGGLSGPAADDYSAWGGLVGVCHELLLAGRPVTPDEVLRKCPAPIRRSAEGLLPYLGTPDIP